VPGGPGSEARGDLPAVGGTLAVELGGNGGGNALCMEAGATELGGMELAIESGSIVRGGAAALIGVPPPCIIALGGSEPRGVKPGDMFVPGGKEALCVEPGGIIEPRGKETLEPGGIDKGCIDVGGIVRGGLKPLCIVCGGSEADLEPGGVGPPEIGGVGPSEHAEPPGPMETDGGCRADEDCRNGFDPPGPLGEAATDPNPPVLQGVIVWLEVTMLAAP